MTEFFFVVEILDVAEAVLEAALASLVRDNPQPSVRFMQEWSLISLLVDVPHLRCRFLAAMDEAVEQRAGSMASFLAVCGHATRCLAAAADAAEVPPWAAQVVVARRSSFVSFVD